MLADTLSGSMIPSESVAEERVGLTRVTKTMAESLLVGNLVLYAKAQLVSLLTRRVDLVTVRT